MKKGIVVLGLCLMTVVMIMLLGISSWAQTSNEFTVPLSEPAKRAKLKAHLNYGSITVKGTGRKDILVKYKAVEEGECEDCEHGDDEHHNKNHNANDDKSRDGLKRIGGGGMDLEVVESNNYVKVQSDSWHNRLNLEIEVPSSIDLEVHTYNGGDLMVTNIQGEVELENYNGEVTALNISGSAMATTYNGEIKVTFDKVTDATPMSFSTYNGDIDLTFPSTLKAALKMKTEQGEIYTGFDVNIVSSGPVQQKDSGSGVYRVKVDDWKRGSVNGGGPDITMKNYNGDIYIRKK
jgi:DUF4097 and DUF4098 domain-containing protein YvlB